MLQSVIHKKVIMNCQYKADPTRGRIEFGSHPATVEIMWSDPTWAEEQHEFWCDFHVNQAFMQHLGDSARVNPLVKKIKVGCECGTSEILFCDSYDVVTDWVCNNCKWERAGRTRSYNAVVGEKERPIVWQHPETGEVRYPGRNDRDMPKYYKDQGYKKVEFDSYHTHQKFCKDNNVVNHRAEGIR